jgi:hypothetical protein
MAYQINLTDGTPFATIADGTINTSTNMILVGKNYAGYGEFLDGNFIHLLENASSVTAPGNPLTGQLWWDKGSNLLKVYNGTSFKTISAATASSTAPTSNVTGDLWYDIPNQQLNVYNGTAFILVGPQSSAGTGTTGAIPALVTDTPAGITHTIIKLTVADTVVGTVSQDAEFTPSGAGIPGFTTIKPGITLASTVGGQVPLFQGTAASAVLLNGVASTGFIRTSGVGQTMSVSLGVLNNTGLTVGSNSDLKASVTGTTATIQNQTQDGNVNFAVNDGGVTTTVMTLDGANGSVNFGATTSVTLAGITKSGANANGNIGSTSNYFNRVFATATTALYADVAERFAADTEYAPGTVVELGGINEITCALNDLSDNVFGVISTRAAFLMNGGAGEDDTHPPVAMTGRVPVRCVGAVKKGDRLVSAGNGLARSALPGEATAFNVIGRSLVDKTDLNEDMVEAIVTIK